MARLLQLLAGAAALLLAASPAMADNAVDVGVNWGSQLSHPLLPASVVKMLKENGISKVKMFDADHWPVGALVDSGIEVMLGIPNDMLETMSSSYSNAKNWVKENVTVYGDKLKLKYVAVGNEPFLKAYNGSFMKTTVPALKNIQKALDEAGIGGTVKAVVPLNADVYVSPDDKPSSGAFRPDINDLMTDMVKFLHDHGAPFVVNIYPFLSLYQSDDFPFDFAFFDGGKNIQDKGGISYSNVFDANYDTLVNALKKAGVPKLKVVVGEAGWPTDGNKNANLKLARRFYDGLLKKLAKKEGTPLRPGKLEVYLFGLFDEDMKSIAPGNFERHWGIFTYDGKPKFPMDLTGQGNDKLLAAVPNVQYLPKQWCVFDDSAKDKSKLPGNIEYACASGDCTALGYGCSCNGLDEKSNISYAFNMYFQMQDQDVRACDFDGLAKITDKNASTRGCLFPVQVVSAGGRAAPAIGWASLLALTAHVAMMLLV
ncbi:glucan endo-1,3-beta-glucosidase 8-like [Phragmites australis]|uniref:glucan endo-1,3-beta-glucosidase 8-like n=1 Tax=Phragmites australis TaxID=29695 RepID=UPI002D784ED3|nr:glucan endo-1,3-beta-glucosidase 8-like [Phragmites australis]